MNNEIKARMDAWTPIEEEILMKIALRYVRDGRTLREAFEQASYRIERTTSACQYRFNSELLKVPFNVERYAKAKAIARDNKYKESKATREGFAESYENAFKRPVFENVPEELTGMLMPIIDGAPNHPITHAVKRKEATLKENLMIIAEEIVDMLIEKNNDYGDAFHTMFKQYGDVYPSIRINEKAKRLANLATGEVERRVDDEPIEQTYEDLAGYSIITLYSKKRLQ